MSLIKIRVSWFCLIDNIYHTLPWDLNLRPHARGAITLPLCYPATIIACLYINTIYENSFYWNYILSPILNVKLVIIIEAPVLALTRIERNKLQSRCNNFEHNLYIIKVTITYHIYTAFCRNKCHLLVLSNGFISKEFVQGLKFVTDLTSTHRTWAIYDRSPLSKTHNQSQLSARPSSHYDWTFFKFNWKTEVISFITKIGYVFSSYFCIPTVGIMKCEVLY